MPYLNRIVDSINKHLSKETLNDKRFQGSDYNAIAYAVQVDNTKQAVLPCIPQSAGEYKGLMFDDRMPLIVYHKVNNKQYVAQAGNSFGRTTGKAMQERASMSLIVLANRKLIDLLPEDLESLLVINFPDGKEDILKSIPGVTALNIVPVSSDLNYERLWAQEFKGYEFEVNPDRAMLSVNYTIESTYNTKCFKLCDCIGSGNSN